MNQNQIKYLECMEKGFREKAEKGRKKLKTICFVGSSTNTEFYIVNMDTCAELVKQIRFDLDKLEKGDAEPHEQETR